MSTRSGSKGKQPRTGIGPRKRSGAKAVDAYLAALPDDRREALEAVRETILANLDPRIEEGIQYGMIGYFLPHSEYPAGYHCSPDQPLPFASLASQKNHMAAYLFCIYCEPEAVDRFVKRWKATGKRLDMGKSCVRFKRLEDVALDAIGDAIREMNADRFVAFYEEQSAGRRPKARSGAAGGGPGAAKKAAKKTATKTAKKTVKKTAKKKTVKKTAKKTAKRASKRSAR